MTGKRRSVNGDAYRLQVSSNSFPGMSTIRGTGVGDLPAAVFLESSEYKEACTLKRKKKRLFNHVCSHLGSYEANRWLENFVCF